MSDNKKAQIQSIKAKITNLAKVQNVSPQQIMTLFLLERAVVRLMLDDELAQNLIFKGGFVGVRVYESTRYTTDIDAIVTNLSHNQSVLKIKHCMSQNINDGVWFEFDSSHTLQTQSPYGGIGISFRGGLGEPIANLQRAQLISIDIGVGDVVTPPPKTVTTKLTIGEGELSWNVYSVETILAEKIHALCDRGSSNSRSKDVYDINLFLSRAKRQDLIAAINATFKNRNTTCPKKFHQDFAVLDTTILKRGWASAIEGAVSKNFDETFQSMIDQLKKLDI